MKYLLRRLLRAALLLIAVSALCFLFTEMEPGSFLDEMRLNHHALSPLVGRLEQIFTTKNTKVYLKYLRVLRGKNKNHSYLNAIIGSTFVALRAGI